MSNENVPSPCVHICSLDENNVCIGCFRTGQEITDWGMMSSDEKKAVREACAQREQSSINFLITGKRES